MMFCKRINDISFQDTVFINSRAVISRKNLVTSDRSLKKYIKATIQKIVQLCTLFGYFWVDISNYEAKG